MNVVVPTCDKDLLDCTFAEGVYGNFSPNTRLSKDKRSSEYGLLCFCLKVINCLLDKILHILVKVLPC